MSIQDKAYKIINYHVNLHFIYAFQIGFGKQILLLFSFHWTLDSRIDFYLHDRLSSVLSADLVSIPAPFLVPLQFKG